MQRQLKIRRVLLLVLIICFLIWLLFFGFFMVKKFMFEPKVEDIKDKTTQIQKEDTVKQENIDASRVDAYMAQNPDVTKEEAKKRVRMNLDKEPYSDTKVVENLDEILILVNKYNGLPQGYVPSDLSDIVSSGENGIVQMRQEAADAFNEFAQAAEAEGFILNACSSFRSYEYQDDLYSNGVASYGQEYADAYWTRPGFSEHQTGLSVDIRMDNDTSDLDAVRNHPKYPWLLENMHKYGFILRYPDDKEAYTLISPESWHLRYVGKDVAKYIYDNDLCLEEYFALQ